MKDLMKIISKSEHDQIEKIEMPEWIEPMLATLTHDYFDKSDWIYERKLDGERCIVYGDHKSIKLMSRNKKELNHRYPEIVEAFKKENVSEFIIDGEIVAFNGNVTDFSKLQNRMHLNNPDEVGNSQIDVYFYAFDIIYINGYDLRKCSLKERKKVLKKYFNFSSPLNYTKYIKEKGKHYLKKACHKGWEGLIAKDYDGRYVSTRSKRWLKFKCENRQEFVIVGYTEPQGERLGFGSILVGYYERKKLRYAGKVGTGFKDDILKRLIKKFRKHEIESSPLDSETNIESSNDIHWLKPKMVADVSFTEWTKNWKLRHPSFKGIRTDKNPKKVVNEEKRRMQHT